MTAKYSSRAVSGLITVADGGVLEATGANGTDYTLTIEPGALLFDEYVTMTPISSMTGLPAGITLGGGVLLEPDSVQLATPATLTIERPIPTTGAVMGVWHEGSGGQLIPAPVAIQNGPLMLFLDHFSGWGSAEAPSQAGAAAGVGVSCNEGEPAGRGTSRASGCAPAKRAICSGPSSGNSEQTT